MNATERALMNVSGLDLLGFFERIGDWLVRAVLKPIKALGAWDRIQKENRALHNMNDHMLRDIGISREDVRRNN
jgi:uncharacterized protein YjiS (DUF1127 family)